MRVNSRGVNNRRQNRYNINCPNCRQCQFCIDPRSTRYQVCSCRNIRLFCQSCRNLLQSNTASTAIVGPLNLRVPTASTTSTISTTSTTSTNTGRYTPPHRLNASISPTPFEICCCGSNCCAICKGITPPHCGRECDICRMRKREREQSNASSSTITISDSRSSTTVSYTSNMLRMPI